MQTYIHTALIIILTTLTYLTDRDEPRASKHESAQCLLGRHVVPELRRVLEGQVMALRGVLLSQLLQ